MAITLLTLALRSKRDILLARQRARQIAGLLGFDPQARLVIAARAFEITWSAYQQRGRWSVIFQIEEHTLQVFAAGLSQQDTENMHKQARAAGMPRPISAKLDPRGVERLSNRVFRSAPATAIGGRRLETPLPPLRLSVEDVAWAVRELSRQTPLNLFEELHQQNQEMLRLLPALPDANANETEEEGRSRAA